jgi:TolB-like protein/Flp pilus assembly protein TadD
LDHALVAALRNLAGITEFNRVLQRPENVPPAPDQPTRWGDLTLLELIGTGARGEVWRAWNPTLQREVALKFLQSGEGAAEAQSLLNEARALARVRHPAVVSVYGIAEHGGRTGMWMEYLRGATLAQEMEHRGALPPREVARLGLELCGALEAVHAAGLVHRDVKPANVILEPDGRVVLTDFGLGLRPELAAPSTLRGSGTPIFMPPESLDGEMPTVQSDLYALGATLWWALAGSPPFSARTLDELREQAARGPGRALGSVQRGLPRGLVTAIEWAMEPAAKERPRNASDLGARLRFVLEEIDTADRRRLRSKAALVGGTALIVAAIAATLLFGRTLLHRWIQGPPSIAVLPLVNLSGDRNEDYFSDGMTEELIGRFAQVGDLRVISRSSVMPFKGTTLPLQEVAKRLRVGFVVEGSVQRAGNRVRVSARLVDPPSGRSVWADTYDRNVSDVFALQRDVAMAVVQKMDAHITPGERARLERTPEVSPEAHTFYLQGLAAYHSLTAEGVRRAILLFRKAAEIDPSYSDPWTGLAYAYDFAVALSLVSHEESSAEALRAARRALQLNPESGRARAILASAQLDHDWDFGAAERGCREALALSPGDADARVELAVTLVQRGRLEEADREARRARDADPLSLMASAVTLLPLLERRRYAEVVSGARDILIMHPDAPWILLIMGQALCLEGRSEEGIASLERSVRLDRDPASLGWLGYAYGRAGSVERARTVLRDLESLEATSYVDPYLLGIVHLGLGDRARALDYVEQAGRSHSPEAKFLRVDPVLDPIRSEPRFQALLSQLRMQN